MTKTKIEWTDETWNPIVGCSVVSPGCTHCYAMRTAHRMDANPKTPQYHGLTKMVNGNPVWTGAVKLHEPALLKPLSWKKPRMIFVNSMGDLFHEWVEDEWIDRVFAVMALCPQHTFQVLTKRAERMQAYVSNIVNDRPRFTKWAARARPIAEGVGYPHGTVPPRWPLPNVWLGVSAEDQRRADERIPYLRATPAAVRFVSAEPLLGQIHFDCVPQPSSWTTPTDNVSDGVHALRHVDASLDWVIVGGESGPNARPMHPDWARSIRDQCVEAGTAFFFKQWGEYRQAADAEVPEHFGTCCESFRTICRNAVDMPLSLESVFLHKPSRYPKCFPNGADGDADCEPVTVMRVGKKAAGRTLDGRTWDQYPEGSQQA